MKGYEDIFPMHNKPHARPCFLLRGASHPPGKREAAKLISVLHMLRDALTKETADGRGG